MVRYLPPEADAIVQQARSRGMLASGDVPGYLSPDLCTALALLLALPTLGYSLLFVPIAWVAQHERTNDRLQRLRRQLEQTGVSAEAPPSAAMQQPGSACPERELPALLV
jgi:hypothetical protein